MSGVEENDIFRGFKGAMHSDGELNYAEIWTKVAAGLRDLFNEKFPDLLRQGGELLSIEGSQVPRRLNGRQYPRG
jgi:hypothetical protein